MNTLLKFNFSRQISANLKFQKQFKFSSDQQYKEDKDKQSELFSINKDINFLKNKIKNESSQIFFNPESTSDKALALNKLQKQLKNLETKANEIKTQLYIPE